MTEEQKETQVEVPEGQKDELAQQEQLEVPEGEDVSTNKDGGVLKQILVEGTGDDRPHTGDTVFVHYVGTLMTGEKFDSSRDRGEQFSFELGKGQVIKGWDQGVASMRKGEKANLICRQDYAYGERGSPPKIPANATLKFEVELFSWGGKDISPAKDGGIRKSILVEGEGYSNPNDEASVSVHLAGKCGDNTFDERDVEFVIGEGEDCDIPEGLETALKKMKKGEKAQISLKANYGFGDSGCPAKSVPTNADLEYTVELKSFEKAKEAWEMDPPEKLEQSKLVKEKGTKYFKEGQYKRATKQYKKVVSYLEHEGTFEGEEADQRKALMLAAHLNLAMCYLKVKKDRKVVESCDKALELDANNEKGLFRRGQARQNLQEYDLALADFKKVLETDPNNKAAKNQIIITNKKVQDAKNKERKLFKGMFEKFAAEDLKKSPQPKPENTKTDVFQSIEHWKNEYADHMLPIEQEMEAFGEVMPQPKYDKEAYKENADPKKESHR